MARPKTRRSAGKPVGVAERLKDAPPTRYEYRGTGRPEGDRTYTVDGLVHRFDGTCHETCEDVR